MRHLSTKDGLPQSFVSGLVQDKQGFVWIATRNGLASFDGSQFKTFRHINNDSSSLASNLLIKLMQAANGDIWVEHESGEIDRINPETNVIEHITKRKIFLQQPARFVKRGWLTDSEGSLWCIQKDGILTKYNLKYNTVTSVEFREKAITNDTIRGLMEDRQKQVWVLTQKGLTKIGNTGRQPHTHFPFTTILKKYPGSESDLIQLKESNNGEIIFGDNRRLVLFNPPSGSFKTIALPAEAAAGIRWIQSGPDGYEYFDMQGTVYRYTGSNVVEPVADLGPVPMRDIQALLVDRSGLIWLGTNANGIYQVDLSAPFFESHSNTISFHADVLKQETGTDLQNFSAWPASDKQFKFSSYFFRYAYDLQKKLWIAMRNQVGYYDEKESRMIKLPPVPFVVDNTNASLGIRGIDFSPDGRLWVAGYNGYTAYLDPANHRWETVLDTGFLKNINLQDGIVNIAVDGDHIWLSSINEHGLFGVDIKTRQIKQFTATSKEGKLPTNHLLGLLKDPVQKNILWIGSYEGLIRFNTGTFHTNYYSINEGLPDNTIYSLAFDDKGFLWISTNKGLCRFDTTTHTLNTFQVADGLPGDEFNRFHHIKLPGGKMAFGGPDGWVLFNPLVMKRDNYLPQVAFTGLKVNNVDISAATSEVQLKKGLNVLDELLLRYNQNTLSFSFAGLEFTQPKKIIYRYKLEGYDNDWITTTKPEAVYTKLPPGRYVLQVNASNTTGNWSDKIKRLSIIVSPPLWRTWWAYVLYVFIGAGWIALFIRYRVNRERMRQEIALKEREAAQLKAVDELKGRFFANITHDFRTPLTLILGPVQQLKRSIAKDSNKRWLDSIERNANQLLQLINQLMDLSKLEAGSLQLNETYGSPTKVIDSCVQSFGAEAASKQLTLQYNYSGGDTDCWFDAGKLQQIANNLIANAIKFTPAGGTIEVFVQTGSGIVLAVSDTGVGIQPTQLPLVFNRFFQVDSGSTGFSSIQGSGIGLALVKELVELQGGTIKAHSNDEETGKWSTVFSVKLPCKMGAENKKEPAALESMPVAASIKDYTPFVNTVPETSVPSDEDSTTILLVEDNSELADFIISSVDDRYTIIHAVNGQQGLDQAFEIMPDLVISDIMMPVMNGYDMCTALKKDERTSHIPVILLTAKASFDDRIEGLSLGADDYLTKPFHVQELLLRINNLVERQKRLREKIFREISQPGLHDLSPSAEPTLQDLFMEKLYALVESNLDKTGFGVEELARLTGMSRANLHRKLKAIAGIPAGEIIRNYRLKRAAAFLSLGHNSSETAYMTGFDSPAYFSKCFKDFYQLTPTEFSQQRGK